MTIAACYLSSEGVVLGADSTSTVFVKSPGPNPGGTEHHYNYAQKIFEVGEGSTLGIALWGLGSLEKTSHRTLIARLADQLKSQAAATVEEVANQWNQLFWQVYSTDFAQVIQRTQQLMGQATRTQDEDNELEFYLQNLSGGF